jgi:hypothetical protein
MNHDDATAAALAALLAEVNHLTVVPLPKPTK